MNLNTKDTWNLRNEALFEKEVAEGVWWVPANTLGKSRYTNKQIAGFVNERPEVKKDLIGNLYEAIQLYQIGDFTTDSAEDDLNVWVKDPRSCITWEKHCPGYYAVLLNRGNCSTDTNWLIYLLKDKFEKWGTMHYQMSDGNGHVWNWFLYNSFHYFIDLTHYKNDYKESAVEDGDIRSYSQTDFILGNIHKTRSPKDYSNYILQGFNEEPSLIYMTEGIEVPDLTYDRSQKPVHMIFDASRQNAYSILHHNEKNMSFGFYKNNTQDLFWENRKCHEGITTNW